MANLNDPGKSSLFHNEDSFESQSLKNQSGFKHSAIKDYDKMLVVLQTLVSSVAQKPVIYAKNFDKLFKTIKSKLLTEGSVTNCLRQIGSLISRDNSGNAPIISYINDPENFQFDLTKAFVPAKEVISANNELRKITINEWVLGRDFRCVESNPELFSTIEELAENVCNILLKNRKLNSLSKGVAADFCETDIHESLPVLLYSALMCFKCTFPEYSDRQDNKDNGWEFHENSNRFQLTFLSLIFRKLNDNGVTYQDLDNIFNKIDLDKDKISAQFTGHPLNKIVNELISMLMQQKELLSSALFDLRATINIPQFKNYLDQLEPVISGKNEKSVYVVPAKMITFSLPLPEINMRGGMVSVGISPHCSVFIGEKNQWNYQGLIHGELVCVTSNSLLAPIKDARLCSKIAGYQEYLISRLEDAWQEFPAVFSRLPQGSDNEIYLTEQITYFKLAEGEDIDTEDLPEVLKVRKEEQDRIELPNFINDGSGLVLIVRNHSVETIKEQNEIENLSNAEKRKIFTKSFPTMKTLISFLRNNFEVYEDRSRGSGSHSILKKDQKIWTLSQFKRSEKESLNFSDAMKVLRSLDISLDAILSEI